jgi:hypothetical protein
MLQDKPPTAREQVLIAVAIATLASLTTQLIGWGVHELQLKFGSKPEVKPEEKK